MNNEPMMMANIAIKGKGSYVQSNLHGNFEIKDVTPGKYIITVSFSGYDSQEIPVEVLENKGGNRNYRKFSSQNTGFGYGFLA